MKIGQALLSLGIVMFVAGCEKPSVPPQSNAATNTKETYYAARGVVRSLPEDGRTVVIRHDAIPGYMPKMTMEFNVRDTNQLGGLQRDDVITFRLVATEDTHWIENVQRVGRIETSAAAPSVVATNPPVRELVVGDQLPDSELLAEGGREIHLSDFRGQALAFTFIFTRCPLPDYCPRMGNNFAHARELILARSNAPTNWQFLSISFDPEFDTPAVLRSYGNNYRAGNADHWLFAVASTGVLHELAPRLDLMITREAGGSISHNLRTVVLDPRGRIYRQFDGNHWTPEQLVGALLEAAQLPREP
jgi:protein SCO1